MMTPTVISQGSAPDTTRHQESLFSPPQRWFVWWLLHCCVQGALVLWQTEGFSHGPKCGGGALIDSPVRNAKLAPAPIWSQLSSGTHRPCPPGYVLNGIRQGWIWDCEVEVECDSDQASLRKLQNNSFDYRNSHNSEVLELHLHFLNFIKVISCDISILQNCGFNSYTPATSSCTEMCLSPTPAWAFKIGETNFHF